METGAAHYHRHNKVQYFLPLKILGKRIGYEVAQNTKPHPKWDPLYFHTRAGKSACELVVPVAFGPSPKEIHEECQKYDPR